MADYGLKGKFEVREVGSEFTGRIVRDEVRKSDLKRDVDVGIKSRTDTLRRYRVSFQADTENGSLRREVMCHLHIIFWRSCGVPSCIIDQSMLCEKMWSLYLRIKLKNCHAGIRTSRRIVSARGLRVPMEKSSCTLFSGCSPTSTRRSLNMLSARRCGLIEFCEEKGEEEEEVEEEGVNGVALLGELDRSSTVSTCSTCAFLSNDRKDCRVFLR